MRKNIKTSEAIFPMPVLMIATYNEDGSIDVMNGENVDIELVNAIAFDPYTHGYYKVTERVGNAFKDGLQLKK